MDAFFLITIVVIFLFKLKHKPPTIKAIESVGENQVQEHIPENLSGIFPFWLVILNIATLIPMFLVLMMVLYILVAAAGSDNPRMAGEGLFLPVLFFLPLIPIIALTPLVNCIVLVRHIRMSRLHGKSLYMSYITLVASILYMTSLATMLGYHLPTIFALPLLPAIIVLVYVNSFLLIRHIRKVTMQRRGCIQ
jgi:hypothetical protein